MVPLLLVLLMNLVLYMVVIFILIRHTRNTIQRRQERMTARATLRLMAGILSIVFLFGLTWIFAALTFTVQELRQTAQILFTIFNVFQGVFLFLFFSVLNLEARESWKEFLSCGRYCSTILHPQLRSNSFDASIHNKLYNSSIRSDKSRIIHTYTRHSNCYTSTPSLISAGECAHRALPIPTTPLDDVTTPTSADDQQRHFTTHTIPASSCGEGQNGHTQMAPNGNGQNSLTAESAAVQEEESNPSSETTWHVLQPLGARVKRLSTMTEHVEEYQLDFLESTDDEDRESRL